MPTKSRVRFAPSPTGYLHVGGARTALFNYLFARQNKGTFVLRIEDTDEVRSTEEALQLQIRDLNWLGVHWDEGPNYSTLSDQGDFGPYRQSRRLPLYRKWAEELLRQGKAYHCFLTEADIEQQKKSRQAQNLPPQVISPYRDWPLSQAVEKISQGASASVRFKTPLETQVFAFDDLVRGRVEFPSDMIGDFVILRTGGMPVYNFCCVIDDHEMAISHVLRAEEHLSNTLRQLMIYEALGFAKPQFAHMSLILGEDRQKLSKRHGATSCQEFKERGYLPEALINFLALLGWSPSSNQEIFSMSELVEQFGLDRLNSAPAVFDEKKLKWMNSQHLRALSNQELLARVRPFLDRAGVNLPEELGWAERALEVFRPAMETLLDSVNLFQSVLNPGVNLSAEGSEILNWPGARGVVQHWVQELKAHKGQFVSESEFDEIQTRVKQASGTKGKNLFMPLRVAVIGQPHGSEMKLIVPLIAKNLLVSRAESVLSSIPT